MKTGTLMVYFMLVAMLCSCQKSEINRKLLPVKSGAKWGYVDSSGKYLINPQFDDASAFWDGLALVKSGELYGYIDEKGEYVINPTYTSASVFMEGIAWTVKKNNPPTAIDRNGNELFSLKLATTVYNYSEGLARFGIADRTLGYGSQYGYVNKNGEEVIPPKYNYATNFHEGLASVLIYGEGYGFINKQGELIINHQFDDTRMFKDGLAVVSDSEKKYGVIDKEGKYVINPQFRAMAADVDGGFIIAFQDGDVWGKCDKSGKTIINPQFDNIGLSGKNGLIPVKISEKYGFVNEKGLIVINPQFQSAFAFMDDYAIVCAGGKWGTIDEKGKYIINPQFDDINNDFVYNSLNIFVRPYSFVISDFFDIEKVVSALKGMITEDKINGNINFDTPVSRIMQEYDLKEESISQVKPFQSVKTIFLSNEADLDLRIVGQFFDKVSDGWWGYRQVLNPNTYPQELQLMINLKNNGKGRASELMSGIKTGFGLSDSASEWSCGKFDLKLKGLEDWVLITITPASAN